MNPRAINPWTPSPSMANQIDAALFAARLPQAGRAYVDACVSNGPSREVQGRSGNNTFTFFSRKTKATLKLESRRGEHALAVQLDHDPKVIAFFAQPPKVTLDVLQEDGSRATTKPYTPDFLVVYEDRLVVIETKDTVMLLEKSQKNPYQFFRDTGGTWHHRAAEAHFHALGMEFRLISTADLSPILVGNLRFLEDFMDANQLPMTQAEIDAVQGPVNEHGFVLIDQLLADGVPVESVYRAIVEQHVYFDLEHDNVASPDSVRLFANKATREALRLVEAQALKPPPPIPGTLHLRSGGRLTIYGQDYTVDLEGERDVRLVNKYGQVEVRSLREIQLLLEQGVVTGEALRSSADPHQLADYTEAEIEKARRKLEAVETGVSSVFSDRSISRFRRSIAGVPGRIDQLLRLMNRNRSKGNREPRVSDVNLNLIEKAVEEGYNTPKQQSKKGAFAKYLGFCDGLAPDGTESPEGPPREESGAPVRPVSYQTFCRYCDDLKDIQKREGRRAAYQKRSIVTSLDTAYPTHGVRPHEVCEMDHTIANISLKSVDGVALGKPTLSIVIDSNTCQIRALNMSFESPSARTVLRLMRDYVRRNQRLPRVLVVDNGKEFHSHELEYFCRIYGVELRYRSPGMPRGAAMVERAFGAIEEEVFSEMAGNTRIMKQHTRQVTKEVDPYRQTEWTLAGVYRATEDYLFKVRANRTHPSLGMTPNEYEVLSAAKAGQRDCRMFALDENMMLMTCPHAKRPKRKVIRGRGVNVNGIYYRHEALDRVRPGSTVEVRVEPYNASVVYVNVRDRWVAATGNSSRWLGQRTHYELECALREQQRLKQLNAKRDGGSAKSLKHKMVPLRPEDFDKRIALQQMELCYLDAQLGFGPALKGIAAVQPAKQPDSSPLAPVVNASVASSEPQIPFPAEAEVPAAPVLEWASSPEPANEARYRRALELGLR